VRVRWCLSECESAAVAEVYKYERSMHTLGGEAMLASPQTDFDLGQAFIMRPVYCRQRWTNAMSASSSMSREASKKEDPTIYHLAYRTPLYTYFMRMCTSLQF
jgi:hypothetical protein